MNREFKKTIPFMPVSKEVNQCARSIIANCLGESWKWDTTEEFEESVKGLAAYIVRAVNSHEELLECVKLVNRLAMTRGNTELAKRCQQAIARAEHGGK